MADRVCEMPEAMCYRREAEAEARGAARREAELLQLLDEYGGAWALRCRCGAEFTSLTAFAKHAQMAHAAPTTD